MRKRVAMLVLAGVATPARADEAPLPSKGCFVTVPELAGQGDRQARFRRLDTLPPAAEILTVIRSDRGCQRPVIVRYGIGGDPRAARR